MVDAGFGRSAAEDFLFHEAELLDGWRLTEWAALFDEQGTYSVPSPDRPDGGPGTSLYLVADDRARIDERVRQLLGSVAWAENPRSRTRHLITNVRVTVARPDIASVRANFAVYRFRHNQVHLYAGEYLYELSLKTPGQPRILSKSAVLDLESLRDVGKVSIIL